MIDIILSDLGIDTQIISRRGLMFHEETQNLVFVEVGMDGRAFFLISEAANAWKKMKQQAKLDGIDLLLISAFRSVARQAEIIQAKLTMGNCIEDILDVCAPPGYSEHHTGRAIDIGSIDEPCLEISFENTVAFSWMKENAFKFGFSMTYPRNNQFGFQYEPWHWCYSNEANKYN